MQQKKSILTTAIFQMIAALAAEDQNLTGKADSQHPGILISWVQQESGTLDLATCPYDF
jgi:hypothetical protein